MNGVTVTSKTLRQLKDHFENNELVLPEIQRDFVWTKGSVLALFDSLYRGFPIGHMLVWKTNEVVAEKRKVGNKLKRSNFYGYLLDGQQRLTAIREVLSGSDDYPLMFSLARGDDEARPYDDRFSWRTKARDKSPWYVRVSDALQPAFSVHDTVERLRQDPDFKMSVHADQVGSDLRRLVELLHYGVGVTEFESEDYRAATELFVRFNATGVKLNAADLAAAELALNVPNIVAEGMAGAVKAHAPNFVFTRPFLLQCLVGVHKSRLELRNPEELWSESPEAQVKRDWARTEKALSQVVEFVTGDLYWTEQSWVPSFRALIPLVYLLAHGSKWTVAERKLARKWLALASVRRLFSGSGHSLADQLLVKLARDPSVKKLWALTRSELKKLSSADFEISQRSGPMMSVYFSYLRENAARDWVRRTPLDGTVLGHNATLEVHHFFPRAFLRRQGHDPGAINEFANYVILSKDTNLQISDAEPAAYVNHLRLRDEDLESQGIPMDRRLWSGSRYAEFRVARRLELARRMNEFLEA